MFTRGGFVSTALLAVAVAVGMLATPAYVGAAESPRVVKFEIRDDCDPATFNAAIGPGTCIGKGDTTFARFVAVVTREHREPQWRFVPDRASMTVGQSFKATDVGGEVHSFTEVAAFGGGIVPFLNQLSNSGPTRPECGAAAAAFGSGTPNSSFVAPGQSFTDTETANDVGHPVLYQCCIHPWMRAIINVRPAAKGDKD